MNQQSGIGYIRSILPVPYRQIIAASSMMVAWPVQNEGGISARMIQLECFRGGWWMAEADPETLLVFHESWDSEPAKDIVLQ